MLVWVIFATAVDPRGQKDFGATAPLAIGLTLTCNAISHGHLTGCSINPARSFGPALVFSRWQYHWVYWLGPCAGALAAAALQSLVMIEHPKQGISSSFSLMVAKKAEHDAEATKAEHDAEANKAEHDAEAPAPVAP